MRPNFTFRKIFLLLFSFLIFNSSFLIGTVRYVSKTGSSTPPYTSWETAADSIQKCINISVFGDTIYVANGVYEEKVIMIAGLSLIGAGSDSCTIDVSGFSNPHAVGVNSNCLLKNFKIIVQDSPQTLGAGIVIGSPNSIVEYNEVLNARSEGIWCYNTNSIIRHNKILNCQGCIQIHFGQPTIDSNYVFTTPVGEGIVTDLNGSPIIRGNIIIGSGEYPQARGFLDWSGTTSLYNNLFFIMGRGAEAIDSYSDIIESNLVYGKWSQGYDGAGSVIKNTHIEKALVGLRFDSGSGGSPPNYKYNNMWNNEVDFQNFTPDTTNIFVDPMIVNPDSMNFHLQKYSPLIDAGDPTILDKDNSRSDIGLYGGPFGESYVYIDLPPRSPVNLTAAVDSNIVTLKWNKSTEADFGYYKLFYDTTKNFQIDSTKLISSQPDTFYYYVIPPEAESLYFKLTAVDNQGNESNPSEEVGVLITSLNDQWKPLNNYILYQNYPNPFNPSTKIGYKLKERGYVKLYVYDIKGELVSVLVNQTQEAGYYEVEFNAEDRGQRSEVRSQLASGLYIYQIFVKGENNIPVFSDIKKMLLVK